MKTLDINHFAFYKASDVIADTVAAAIRPDEKLTVSEWADRNRLLDTSTSPEPGLWKTRRTPYLREIQDELSPTSPTQTTTFVKGCQLGGTEAGLNWIGTIVDKYPQPIMMVTPSLSMLRKNSRTRIQPMLENTPCLMGKVKSKTSKEAGNSVDLKEFRGGLLVLTTAGSATGLRSQPVQALFFDEMSAYDNDVDDEGDPVALGKARTNNFGRRKKIFQVSTPTIRGACRVEQEFAKSDKRYYNIPCIHCGDLFVITWNLIKYKQDEDHKLIEDSVHLECPHCKGRIEEHHKTWFLSEENGAKWIPTAKGERLHKGYHLSSLYSPLGWNAWIDIINQWIVANENKKKGDFTQLKTFCNTILAESWEDPASRITEDMLWGAREDWLSKGYDVPNEAAILTIGCDIQKDRLEVSVYAWGEGEEGWGIAHRILWGDPTDLKDVCWEKLDNMIYKEKWKHEGGKLIGVTCACVDSGNWSDLVYKYVISRKQKGVFAVKGNGREDHPVIKRSKQFRHGKNRQHVALFHVGTFDVKRMLYLRVQASPENRIIHYPVAEDFDEEFFKQLSAEYLVTKFVKGFPKRHFALPSGYRNESLDCFVYAFAALRIADPSIRMLKEQLGTIEKVIEEVEEVTTPTHMEEIMRKRRKTRRPSTSKLHKRRS